MRRAGSSDRRPQLRIAVTGEVADVRRCHNDLIARLANHYCTCGQNDIGVECIRGGGRHAALAGVCSEQRGLAPRFRIGTQWFSRSGCWNWRAPARPCARGKLAQFSLLQTVKAPVTT